MMSKLGAALVCLVFAIPFGGVGLGASWVLYRMIHDGHRAEDWVKAKATVDSYERGSVSYRYSFRGVEYQGDRLGANPIGGTDDIDSWHDDMAAAMSAAKDGKPITVWVNPDNPAESMVDRTIRWKLAVFIIPFALGFGGVGVGAVWMFFRTLFGSTTPKAAAKAEAGIGVLWFFTLMWNAISVPIALLVVPDAIAQGEWLALLVLLFPLIGALLLWGAIAATVKRIRDAFAPKAEQPIVPRPPANDGVFARGMIGDAPAAAGAAGAIDTMDDGLPPPPDPVMAEIEKLSGRKLSAAQKEQLEGMDPKVRAVVTKMAGFLGKIRQEHE